MLDRTREVLTEFVRRANQIVNTSFIQTIEQSSSKAIDFRWDNDGHITIWMRGEWPDEEAIGNVARLIRFFNQDNERTSLCNMANTILTDPGTSEELREGFQVIRDAVNKNLDSTKSLIGGHIVVDNKPITPRMLMDTVLYGELVHGSPRKQDRYRLWMSNPFWAPVMSAAFQSTLQMFIHYIHQIAKLCQKELDQENKVMGNRLESHCL